MPVGLTRAALALACAVAAATPHAAAAQHRVADALSFADIASGSLTGLGASCKSENTTTAVQPTIPGLPRLPGAGPSPSERQFYFAGAAGAGVLGMNSSLRDGHGVGLLEGRVHFVPAKLCWLDAAAVVNASTSSALAGTAEFRIFPLQGSQFAPAIELTAGQVFGGANEPGQIDVKFSARISATTPNLYALTIGRLGDWLVGDRWPKLDIRARVFVGRATFADDHWMKNWFCLDNGSFRCPTRMSLNGGGVYNEFGGTAAISVLHIPVSLLATTEQIDGVIPVSRPPMRESLGLAFRMPGFNKNLWLVTRAERYRDLETTSAFRIELTHLLLGAR